MHIYPASFFADRDYPIRSDLCFVIMPFSAPWSRQVYETINAVVDECGYNCRRADDFYGRMVLADVWRGLNEATFVVAELSDGNPNVFYELGLGHALGKDSIPLLQDGQTVPFDQAPFRVLSYEYDEAGMEILRTQLAQWITSLDFIIINQVSMSPVPWPLSALAAFAAEAGNTYSSASASRTPPRVRSLRRRSGSRLNGSKIKRTRSSPAPSSSPATTARKKSESVRARSTSFGVSVT